MVGAQKFENTAPKVHFFKKAKGIGICITVAISKIKFMDGAENEF